MLPSAGLRALVLFGVICGCVGVYLSEWGLVGVPDVVSKALEGLAVLSLIGTRAMPRTTIDDRALRSRVGEAPVNRLSFFKGNCDRRFNPYCPPGSVHHTTHFRRSREADRPDLLRNYSDWSDGNPGVRGNQISGAHKRGGSSGENLLTACSRRLYVPRAPDGALGKQRRSCPARASAGGQALRDLTATRPPADRLRGR